MFVLVCSILVPSEYIATVLHLWSVGELSCCLESPRTVHSLFLSRSESYDVQLNPLTEVLQIILYCDFDRP